MPKIENSTKPFIVSFNGEYGEYEIGDDYLHSADWEGDTVPELIEEVCNGDPDFPMYFEYNKDTKSDIIGCFYSVDELDYPEDERGVTAVMMTNAYFYS